MKKYLDYLVGKQNPDGSFGTDSEKNQAFFTALILSSLSKLENKEETTEAKQRAVAFLLSRKNNDWIFSENINKNFSIISALCEYDNELLDGTALAKILNLLTEIESQVGGPYFMDRKNKKIDTATNFQIAYFLSLHKVTLPNLDLMVDEAVESGKYESCFYKSPYPLLYSLSRFYQGDEKNKIFDYIINSGVIRRGSNYDRLFAMLALKNLNFSVAFLDDEILVLEKDWTGNGPSKNLLEFALLLELKNKKNAPIDAYLLFPEEEAGMMTKIKSLARERFSKLSLEMQELALLQIEKTIVKNIDKQMSLMAFFVKKSLGKKGQIFSDDFIAELGLNNIFFWNAFIIYDDFWDEEGVPRFLPTANLFAREFIKYFNLILPTESGLQKFFDCLMDKLDIANTWETIHCRAEVVGNIIKIPDVLPDYGDYEVAYAPASAHILGPLVLFKKLGYDLESDEVKNLIKYFRNCLIAMQINDDACDWEDDLARGHLSTVVVMLLQDYLEKYPDRKVIDMALELEDLKKIYWFTTLKQMAETALSHTSQAREALLSLESVEDNYFLERLINETEMVAQRALDEQKKTIDFLGSFSG